MPGLIGHLVIADPKIEANYTRYACPIPVSNFGYNCSRVQVYSQQADGKYGVYSQFFLLGELKLPNDCKRYQKEIQIADHVETSIDEARYSGIMDTAGRGRRFLPALSLSRNAYGAYGDCDREVDQDV